jgi:hypothetical protein
VQKQKLKRKSLGNAKQTWRGSPGIVLMKLQKDDKEQQQQQQHRITCFDLLSSTLLDQLSD